MLINIVGCDGTGKTTQMEMIQPWIEAVTGLSVRTLSKRSIFDGDRFPEARLFGPSYEDIMTNIMPTMQGESRSLFLFFILAVAICRYPPSKHEVVLLDGGWQKHYATEAVLGVPMDWLKGLGSGLPEPDLTVLLDMAPSRIVTRRQLAHESHGPYECGCRYDLTDEAFLENMTQCQNSCVGSRVPNIGPWWTRTSPSGPWLRISSRSSPKHC